MHNIYIYLNGTEASAALVVAAATAQRSLETQRAAPLPIARYEIHKSSKPGNGAPDTGDDTKDGHQNKNQAPKDIAREKHSGGQP